MRSHIAPRIAGLLAAVCLTRGAPCTDSGDDSCIEPSVILLGTLVNKNNELNVIKGGETLTLTLTTDGPDGPIKYKPETVESEAMFSAFLDDFAHAAGEDTFVSRVSTLIRRENAVLSDDRRTLSLTLSPDAHFKLRGEEHVYLNIPSIVLDCKCSYRIPVLTSLTLIPAQAPHPIVHAPPVVCASTFPLEVRFIGNDLLPIVRENVKVKWEILSVVGEHIVPGVHDGSVWLRDDTALTTHVGGMVFAGNVTVKVSLIVLDSVESSTIQVERIESPEPAEVAQSIMHVAGNTARLSATPLPEGTSSGAHGEWFVGYGSPDVVFEDYSDPHPLVRNLTTPTKIVWRVSGHPKCKETTAEIDLKTEAAVVYPHDPEICTPNKQTMVIAAAPTLSRLRGEWSVVDTPGEAEIFFVPSADAPKVTAVGFDYGTTTLAWTLHGDGDSTSSATVTFTRHVEPKAMITTRSPTAFLGTKEVELSAERPHEGNGRWGVRSSTCRGPLEFLNATDANTVLLGVEYLSEPCRVEITWTVSNEPCAGDVDSLFISIIPRPPTKPEVGPPIVMCEEGEVRLTGNKVEVGEGLWTAVDPIDQVIPDPTRPRAVLPSVRVGKTVVRWGITSGNSTEHADLLITKHALPDAVISDPREAEVFVCGATLEVAGSNDQFGPGDFGRWGLVEGTARCVTYDSSEAEACTADMAATKDAPQYERRCPGQDAPQFDAACDPAECVEASKIKLTQLPPGRSVVEWVTNNRASEGDCPRGRRAELVVNTYQFPSMAHDVYTIADSMTLDLVPLLFAACEGLPQFYPKYLKALAALDGTWRIGTKTSKVVFSDTHAKEVLVSDLPIGTTTVHWTPTVCAGTPHTFTVNIVRGKRMSCHIYQLGEGESGGGHVHVVGDTVELSIGRMEFPLSARGTWSADAAGVAFSNPDQDATVVSNLPPGDTTVVFHILAAVPAFNGECEATITSYRAAAPPSAHAVCATTAEVRAEPLPDHTPAGLTAHWSTVDAAVAIDTPLKHTTTVTGLSPGGNILTWTVGYRGVVDSVNVVVERHMLALPFGATGLTVEKKLINMKSLVLPWEGRAEWPQTPEEWTVPQGHRVRYEPGQIVLEGFATHAPAAEFRFPIKPAAGSACLPALFSLRVVAVAADIVATTIASECELLGGTSIVLSAGKGLEWKAHPLEEDFATLRRALGETLDTAFAGAALVNGHPEQLRLDFAPAVLPGVEPSVKAMTVRNVPIPRDLLASHVVTQPDGLVLFRDARGVVGTEFTVWPVDVELGVDGRSFTTEQGINEGGAKLLEMKFKYLTQDVLTRFVEDLPKGWIAGPEGGNTTAEQQQQQQDAADNASPTLRAHLLDSLTSGVPEADIYGWTRRRSHILQYNGVAVNGGTVQVRMSADSMFTIGEPAGFQMEADLSVVCGFKESPDEVEAGLPSPPRKVISNRVVIEDTPGELRITGDVNECDFEKLGANLTVTAVGCSFADEFEVKPMYFVSNQSGLAQGWDAMVSRGIFNASSIARGPKERVLRIEPLGAAIYEIPQGAMEALTLTLPASGLVHPPKNLTAVGDVAIHDTSIEVEGTTICADALRAVGHTITLRLLGDSWVPGITEGRRAADLVGALAGNRTIKNGWETAMMSYVLPRTQFKVTLLSPSELQVTLYPMKGYTNAEPESVGLKIPGVSTRCSKCLEHKALMNIYHAHDMVADTPELHRETDTSLTLRLPCARYSVGATSEEVLAGVYASAPVEHGFDAHRDAILREPVTWVDNQTVSIPLHWPAGLNVTHDEQLSVVLPDTAVVPHAPGGRKIRLVTPVVLRATPQVTHVGFLARIWRQVAFIAPLLLYAVFFDFMKLENVGRYIERQAAAFRLPFTDFVGNALKVQFALWLAQVFLPVPEGHWVLRVAGAVYPALGVFGSGLYFVLLVCTDFRKLRRFGTEHFGVYVDTCSVCAVCCILDFLAARS